ncbi:23774_t:CDS:2 [Gigaspora rosea]|nr:23774_t:CDS:2 [Gigaspora rosea]
MVTKTHREMTFIPFLSSSNFRYFSSIIPSGKFLAQFLLFRNQINQENQKVLFSQERFILCFMSKKNKWKNKREYVKGTVEKL